MTISPTNPAMPSRRQILRQAGCGAGLLGLATLLQDEGLLAQPALNSQSPMNRRPSHFPAAAKRVIWIFVNGGPSHIDTWDYKPKLEGWHGKSIHQFDSGFKNTTGFFKNAVGHGAGR